LPIGLAVADAASDWFGLLVQYWIVGVLRGKKGVAALSGQYWRTSNGSMALTTVRIPPAKARVGLSTARDQIQSAL
jgi:hypothetical protein